MRFKNSRCYNEVGKCVSSRPKTKSVKKQAGKGSAIMMLFL